MSSAREAVSGFERLVTRSLAIVAIAVAAGAAHSWLNGPLGPKAPITPTAAVNGENEAPGPEPNGEDTSLAEGYISLEDAHEHLLQASAIFLDARPKEEFEAGHIDGAFNLSLEMTRDTEAWGNVKPWLDAGLPIIVYCRGGLCSEAKDITRLLTEDAGYENVLILGEGFPAWEEAGYAVGTGPGL